MELRNITEERERIERYMNGDRTCDDVLMELKQLEKFSLGKTVKLVTGRPKPEKKTYFESPCPHWFQERGSSCAKDKVTWLCMTCFNKVRCPGSDLYLRDLFV